ncbi:response regulator [candidate division KSB1 bacterium]|nr:response regulator [candidate division KSB1 bacterium]NIR70862.1 response regulator [candidate division KSB1 bacterium]NIS24648.1 response regulator [candidate division KSB1 bacterium]NIT71550.1 response regulator [candidate division KSB1 bacterium]NIU25248.1 response regulator [candidate division KSB1 bacterium]
MKEKIILLVEDEPDDEALTLRALKQNNIKGKVVVAHDGVEALNYLWGRSHYADRDTSIMPQIIFLDLKLPRMNGLEFLRHIRSDKRTRLLPVVILTSSKEEEDILNAYAQGANSYIRKPVDFKEFGETVRQLASYWLLLNEAPTNVIREE